MTPTQWGHAAGAFGEPNDEDRNEGDGDEGNMDQMTSQPRRTRLWRDATAAAVIAFVLSLPVLGYPLLHLNVPWGSGDLIAHYMSAQAWAPLGFPVSTTFGYPSGIDLAYIPTIDMTQNAFAWLVDVITGSPYAGLNLLLVLSFPLVAALAVIAFRLVGARGPLAIALAVAFTFIPYHFDRGLSHLYPATMYAGVTGVILTLWIGTGRTVATKKQAIAIAVLILVTGWSGMYYSAFAIAITLTAVTWRWMQGDAIRRVGRDALIPISIAGASLLAFLPGAFRLLTDPPIINMVERNAADSVAFAGNLAQLLTPYANVELPVLSAFTSTLIESQEILGSAGESGIAGFGTFISTAALLVFLVGWAVRARRGRSTQPLPFVALLITVGTLFFVPWGTGYLVAGLITPQLRAWGRLSPILLLLFLVGAAAVFARTRWNQPKPSVIPAVVIVAIVFVTNVLPFRAAYAQAVDDGRYIKGQLQAYTTSVNAAISERCGILQLPFMAFPENGIREPGLNDYEHGRLGLANPNKFSSYGTVKGTQEAVLTAALTDPPSRSQLDQLRQAGFCAIHLDKRGYTDVAWQRVTTMLGADLGAPVAEGLDGAWITYRL